MTRQAACDPSTAAPLRPVATLAAPDHLESLAVRIFGTGDRPRGWFARKLVRECVDAELSLVAHRACTDASDPATWLGYVLVGAPPSLYPGARTSGVGVVPEARGQGLGRRLVDAACGLAASRGFRTLHTPASTSRAAFYERLGFKVVSHAVALLKFIPPGPCQLDTPGEIQADVTADAHEVSGWLREAVDRTPRAARRTLTRFGVRIDAAYEGQALVLHRVSHRHSSDRNAAARMQAVLRAIDAALAPLPERRPRQRQAEPRPVVLVGADPREPLAARLQARGWMSVQQSVGLTRELAG